MNAHYTECRHCHTTSGLQFFAIAAIHYDAAYSALSWMLLGHEVFCLVYIPNVTMFDLEQIVTSSLVSGL